MGKTIPIFLLFQTFEKSALTQIERVLLKMAIKFCMYLLYIYAGLLKKSLKATPLPWLWVINLYTSFFT